MFVLSSHVFKFVQQNWDKKLKLPNFIFGKSNFTPKHYTMAISNAIPSGARSSINGTNLAKGNFSPASPFLPQSITIISEANAANQADLSLELQQITSARQAGTLFGYGSPIYSAARILFPVTGVGVTVPVYVLPVEEPSGAAAQVFTVTPTGNATAAATIYLKINGRRAVDGASYGISVAVGDTPTIICNKFRTAIAACLGAPVIGSGTATLIATSKWAGETSALIDIEVDLDGNSIGTTFAVADTTAGTGATTVTTALARIVDWNTIIINGADLSDTDILDEYEAWNGIPDPLNPTGRFNAIDFKPALVFTGTRSDDPTAITDARPDDCTIVASVAPLSKGFPIEAASNVVASWVAIAQSTPNLSALNQRYPDMPAPPAGSNPATNSWVIRDQYVKKGCSTVDFVNGTYVIKDLVTTYHPTGEAVPHYSDVRAMNIFSNYVYRYNLMKTQNWMGRQLARDSDAVNAPQVIKPSGMIADVFNLVLGAVRDGLLVDAEFTKATIVVEIDGTNPNRVNDTHDFKISGIAYITSSTITGGFNFN